MAALRACPFCRTLYRPEEGRVCSECGVALVPMHTLGPSLDSQLDEPHEPMLPEHETLPWSDLSRYRGALLGLCLLGLAAFFSPWVEVVKPETAVYSGFDLARGRAGWLWGGAAAYFVMLPLVLTRRTIARLRGVRLVCVLFASLTAFEAAMLFLLPPRGHALIPVRIEWRWGLYVSGVISLLATFFSARLGGALPALPEAPPRSAPVPSVRPDGETIH